MTPDPRFRLQPKYFWANVRSVSQELGYTDRKTRNIRVPTFSEIAGALGSLELDTRHIISSTGNITEFGQLLHDYFLYRAKVLNEFVCLQLMDAAQAKSLYESVRAKYNPRYVPTMNKQKGEKKAASYLTAMTNLLIAANTKRFTCDFDPRSLTSITKDKIPLRTLARRVDGAFPSVINPVAVWEIKEYYYTTTFGSRVADGVYETLLDGMELEELQEHEGIKVQHILIVDAKYTWWDCGRSYLCRIIDMLHMGYIDEVLFGREIVNRLPIIAKEWVKVVNDRKSGRGNKEEPSPGESPPTKK